LLAGSASPASPDESGWAIDQSLEQTGDRSAIAGVFLSVCILPGHIECLDAPRTPNRGISFAISRHLRIDLAAVANRTA
jgi:hypothetical protein